MMKRIIAIFLSLFIVVAFCGCNDTTIESNTESWVEGTGESDGQTETDNSSGGNDTKEEHNSKITDALAVNLNGATITVYDSTNTFTPTAGNKTAKAQLQIFKDVEEKTNCKFNVKTVDDEKLKTLIVSSAASGKALCNIVCPSMYDVGYYIAAGVMTDLTRVSTMDLSHSYMNNLNMLNASKLGNARYAATIEVGTRTWVTFYNKRILKELGYSDNYLYDLVDSNNWNYSICREIGKKAMKELDGKSGMSKDDQWGFLFVDHSMMTSHAIINNGGALIKYNKEDYLEYNMNDPKVISSINLMYDFYRNDGTVDRSIDNYLDRIDSFAAGHSLFLFSNLHHAPKISAKMSDEFGLLPIPMVDGSGNYITALDWNAGVMMIPAGQSAKDQRNSGAVMQAILSQTGKILSTCKNEYSNRYLCDKKSADNMVLAIKNDHANPEAVFCNINEDVLSGTYRPFWDLLGGRITSVATAIEQTKAKTVAAINEINATAKKNKS